MSPLSETTAAERRQQLELLRLSAASFAGKESPPSRARALRGKAPGFDLRFWSALAAQGWTGLLAPESAGGYGQGLTEMAEVAGALAAQAAPEPLVPVVVFAGRLLEACGDSEMACGLLAELAEGRSLPTVAWQEDATGEASFDGRGGLADPATVCASGQGQLRLSGRKQHLRPGAAATGCIVTASSSEGLALIWVPITAQGLEHKPLALADGSFAARLDLQQAEVPADHLLARGATAQQALARAYDETLVLAAAELAATARRMVTMTLDYLRTRKQFGKPIGSFQAVKHHLADVATRIEFAKPALYRAAYAVAHGEAGADARVSHAKLACGEAAWLAARHGIQVHGAMGYTWEVDLQMFMKRAWALDASWGDRGFHKARVADAILVEGAALGPGHTFEE